MPCTQKTIVRGHKTAKDGSLAWLLDEFETMSVSRSNSLRRDSPPFPARHDQLYQENGLSEVLGKPHPHPLAEDAGSRSKEHKERNRRHGAKNETERHRDSTAGGQHSRGGQEPSGKSHPHPSYRTPPPDYHKPTSDSRHRPHERDSKKDPPVEREPSDRVVRRDRPEGRDKRPKSTYTGEISPKSSREKRPLSGPNIRTPNIPISEGVMKTAQQTGRPFNTYPRADTDPVRGAQVKGPVPPPPPSPQWRSLEYLTSAWTDWCWGRQCHLAT